MTRLLPSWRLLLIAMSIVLLVACSDSATPAGLQGAPMVVPDGDGVCGLLASEEVELALNAPVESGDRSNAVAGDADRTETDTAAASPRTDPAGRRVVDQRKPPILPGMEMCRVSSRDGRVIWGMLADGAAKQFRRYRDWHGDELQGLRVEGHDAVWDEELRTLVVLSGDHAVGVQLTVPDSPVGTDDGDDQDESNGEQEKKDETRDNEAKRDGPVDLRQQRDEDEAAYLRAQAVELASRALRRL